MDQSSTRTVQTSLRDRLAAILSIVGHPFLFPPAVALVAGCWSLGIYRGSLGLITIVGFCLLPSSLYIWQKVRSGAWSDLDVSSPKDRPHLFFIGFGFLLLTVVILLLTGQPIIYARGCLTALILIAIGWYLNRWLKPSMHAGFAMTTATALWSISTRWAIAGALLACGVAWSRVQLGRHSFPEVVLGLALGFLVARILLT